MAPGVCHATCPLRLNDFKVGVGIESGVESHGLGREPMKPCSDSAALAAHPDRRPMNLSLWAALTSPLYASFTAVLPPAARAVKDTHYGRVLLLWLLLRAPIAASLPLEVGRHDAEREAGRVPPSAIDGVDFTSVTPGSFDKPLDFLGTPEGSHGRALDECVRAMLRNPLVLQSPISCLSCRMLLCPRLPGTPERPPRARFNAPLK